MSAKGSRVMEQFEGNRYVGIHIALGMNDQEKRPLIRDVIEGGPADRAGVKKDDLIELIDGVDTKGMDLREAVDRLRGQEGTDVTIKVRQPKINNSRTYTITRGQHARSTLQGVRKRPNGALGLPARCVRPHRLPANQRDRREHAHMTCAKWRRRSRGRATAASS